MGVWSPVQDGPELGLSFPPFDTGLSLAFGVELVFHVEAGLV